VHELEATERQGWDALCGPEGAAFYEDLMAEDGLMVFPGLVLDKAHTVRAIRAEDPWTSYEMSDVRIIETSEGGIVVYAASATGRGGGVYRALMSSVYARRDGRWRLVLHQQAPAPRTASKPQRDSRVA
jgi:hypothetical protein